MRERRGSERYEYSDRVEVKLYSVSGREDLKGKSLLCRSCDISEGGLCLQSDTEIPVDSRVKLRVFITDPPSTFTHSAHVRWVKEDESPGRYAAGLEFERTSSAHMDEWCSLVRHVVTLREAQGMN